MSYNNPPRAIPPALRIPSFLYEGEKTDNPKEGRLDDADADIIMSSIDCNGEPAACVGRDLYVVFYSGGKDSLLALRSVIKKHQEALLAGADDSNDCNTNSNARILNNVVLLTTYDATNDLTTNKISLDIIRKQAQTLKIPLVAVPLYHQSSDRYSKRIRLAMDLIHRRIFNKTSQEIEDMNQHAAEDPNPTSTTSTKIETTLVFGDLHVEHLRLWRDRELSSGLPPYHLAYPLWKVPYNELYDELEKSEVACVISNIDYTAIRIPLDGAGGSTETYYEDFGDSDEDDEQDTAAVAVATAEQQQAEVVEKNKKMMDLCFAIGDLFDRKLFDKLMAEDSQIDAFGENGEFDTIVEVWATSRRTALGLI